MPIPGVVPGTQPHRLGVDVLSNRDRGNIGPGGRIWYSSPVGLRNGRHEQTRQSDHESKTAHTPMVPQTTTAVRDLGDCESTPAASRAVPTTGEGPALSEPDPT